MTVTTVTTVINGPGAIKKAVFRVTVGVTVGLATLGRSSQPALVGPIRLCRA